MVAILSSVQPAAEPVVPGELRYARRLNSGVRRHKFAGALPCQRLAPVVVEAHAAFFAQQHEAELVFHILQRHQFGQCCPQRGVLSVHLNNLPSRAIAHSVLRNVPPNPSFNRTRRDKAASLRLSKALEIMLRHFLLFAFATLASFSAHSVTTTFRVWGSPWLYYVPPEQFNQAFVGTLSDGSTIVHALVVATGSEAVDPESGKIVIKGDKISLCYGMRPARYSSGAAGFIHAVAIPAVTYAQALEYTIAGLPKNAKYSYQVGIGCN